MKNYKEHIKTILLAGLNQFLLNNNIYNEGEILSINNKLIRYEKYNLIRIGDETYISLPLIRNFKLYYKLLYGNEPNEIEKLYINIYRKHKGIIYKNTYRTEDIVNLYLSTHGIYFISLSDMIVTLNIGLNKWFSGKFDGLKVDISERSITFYIGNMSYVKVLPSLSHKLKNMILNNIGK